MPPVALVHPGGAFFGHLVFPKLDLGDFQRAASDLGHCHPLVAASRSTAAAMSPELKL